MITQAVALNNNVVRVLFCKSSSDVCDHNKGMVNLSNVRIL